jgi:hypothetical protein
LQHLRRAEPYHEEDNILLIESRGPRGGLSIKEVLETMLNESSFACLILTGDDIDKDIYCMLVKTLFMKPVYFKDGSASAGLLFVRKMVSKSFQISVV